MEDRILLNMENPEALEQLYRSDPKGFEKSFQKVYPTIYSHPVAQTWYSRLQKPDSGIHMGNSTEWLLLLLLSLLAWFVTKLPIILGIEEDSFFQRNISFTVFPFLTLWFLVKNNARGAYIFIPSLILLLSAFYVNILPNPEHSQTSQLACIHMALLMWFVTGFAFSSQGYREASTRLSWLRFNGDMVVVATVLSIAGFILSLVTIGLFEAAGISIENFYFKNIATWGGVTIPLLSTHMVQSNPRLVEKVSPLVARIFTPMVTLMLLVYLIALPFSGKNPFSDRDFLLIFNILLLGVMALILFALSGGQEASKAGKFSVSIILTLAMFTLVVNGIALSAIIYRIGQWGLSPNRLAVLISNFLIFTNLLRIAYKLLLSIRKKASISDAEREISFFLPLYALWIAFVVFVFPLLFNFS